MIKELLEKRDLLADIATELYGELWIAEDAFWGSTTEKQMMEVEEQLINLGWVPDEPTDEQIALGEIIFEEILKKNKFPRK